MILDRISDRLLFGLSNRQTTLNVPKAFIPANGIAPLDLIARDSRTGRMHEPSQKIKGPQFHFVLPKKTSAPPGTIICFSPGVSS